MGVTGLHKINMAEKGCIQGPQKNVGDTLGGLYFTGEAQNAATVLKFQVIRPDNRTQDHGGVEGS